MEMTVTRFLIILFLTEWLNGIDSIAVDHSTAVNQCTDRGGLIAANTLINDHAQTKIENLGILQLGNGESAWISGYAEFSLFVGWDGCYSADPFLTGNYKYHHMDVGYDINNCSRECIKSTNQREYRYIGLVSNECFCLTYIDIRYIVRSPNSRCTESLPALSGTFKEHSNPKEDLSVYVLYSEWAFSDSLVMFSHLCVYTKINRNTFAYGTDNCNSEHNSICGSSYNEIKETCGKKDLISRMCLVSQQLTRLEAQGYCRNHSGQLYNHLLYKDQEYLITSGNGIYWTGIFRTYKIVDHGSDTHVSSTCLSLRRDNNNFTVEPDDCSHRKRIVCANTTADGSHEAETTYSSPTTLESTEVVTDHPTGGTTETIDQKTLNDRHHDIIYIAMACAVVVVLLIIISIVLYFKCFRNKGRSKTRNHRSEERYCEYKGNGHGRSLEEQGATEIGEQNECSYNDIY